MLRLILDLLYFSDFILFFYLLTVMLDKKFVHKLHILFVSGRMGD